jgi:hypothetical protein
MRNFVALVVDTCIAVIKLDGPLSLLYMYSGALVTCIVCAPIHNSSKAIPALPQSCDSAPDSGKMADEAEV